MVARLLHGASLALAAQKGSAGKKSNRLHPSSYCGSLTHALEVTLSFQRLDVDVRVRVGRVEHDGSLLKELILLSTSTLSRRHLLQRLLHESAQRPTRLPTSFPGYNSLTSPSRLAHKFASPFLARCVEGTITFSLDGGASETLTAKESIFVTAGTSFAYEIKSAYARMYGFAGKGGGLAELFATKGRLVAAGGKHEVLGETNEWKMAL